MQSDAFQGNAIQTGASLKLSVGAFQTDAFQLQVFSDLPGSYSLSCETTSFVLGSNSTNLLRGLILTSEYAYLGGSARPTNNVIPVIRYALSGGLTRTEVFNDSFTYGASNLVDAADWDLLKTTGFGCTVNASNEIVFTSSGNVYTAGVGQPDQYAEIDILGNGVPAGTANSNGLLLRATQHAVTPSTYFVGFVSYYDNTTPYTGYFDLVISRFDSEDPGSATGTVLSTSYYWPQTTLGQQAFVPYTLRAEVVGSTIYAYINGQLVATATDATYSTNLTGVQGAAGGASSRGDNFKTGTIVETGLLLKAQRLLTCAQATFTLTGVDATLKYNKLNATPNQTFTLTGIANTLLIYDSGYQDVYATTYWMRSDPVATFTLTGSNTLFKQTEVEATGTFTFSGSNTLFKRSIVLAQATFTLTGVDATLTYTPISGDFTLDCAPNQTFALTGNANLFQLKRSAGPNQTFTLGSNATGTKRGLIFVLTGPSADPYAANVKSLLNFNSATDETGRHTLTANGTASFDTGVKQFGSASGSSPFGGSNYFSLTDNLSDFVPGTGQFTVDIWYRQDTSAANPEIFRGDENGVIILWFSSTTNLVFGRTNVFNDITGTIGFTPAADTWYHIAVQRDGSNQMSLYFDGTRIAGPTTVTTDFNTTPTNGLHFNRYKSDKCWADDFRLTIGVARYSGSTITVPQSEFSIGALSPGFSATGVAANLRAGRLLNCTPQQTFTLTGTATALNHGYRLDATPQQTFTYTGNAITLLRGLAVPLTAQAFTLTGPPQNLLRGARIDAAPQQSFTLVGVDAALTYVSNSFTAETGTFTLGSFATGLNVGKSLTCATGAFTLTGIAATLTYTVGFYIGSVDADDAIVQGQTGVIILPKNGEPLWAASGNRVTIDQGSIRRNQTVTAESTTSITITVDLSGFTLPGSAFLMVHRPRA
jgi:Concanavalin A-like lectin/glucanases superfamily